MPDNDKKPSKVMSDIIDWIKSRPSKKRNEEAIKDKGPKYSISQDPEDKKEISFHVLVHGRIWFQRRPLMRIVAIVDSEGNVLVHKGDKGGYVESTDNLSQEGTCWISDNACVFEGGRVEKDAYVSEKAYIFLGAVATDRAKISGLASVCMASQIGGDAEITEKATIIYSTIGDKAKVSGRGKCYKSSLYGQAEVSGNTSLCRADLCDNAKVLDDSIINEFPKSIDLEIYDQDKSNYDYTNIVENPQLPNDPNKNYIVSIYGNGQLLGKSKATNGTQIYGDAILKDSEANYSQLFDNVQAMESKINESVLSGSVKLYKSNIDKAEIGDHVELNDSTVKNAQLWGSLKINNSKIFQSMSGNETISNQQIGKLSENSNPVYE